MSLQTIEPDPYARRFKYPKWNRTVTVTDVPRLFDRLPEFAQWDKARHLRAARDYMAYARAYASTARTLIAYGDVTYGTEGTLISGGFRDAWPASLKDVIRVHAQGSTSFLDKSVAHWQAAGRRMSTWRDTWGCLPV